MSLHRIIGYGVLTIAVWKLIQRQAFKKANTLNVSGPDKDHWFKGAIHCSPASKFYTRDTHLHEGNLQSMFVDGFERCLKLAADYGGAVKIHSLFGVRGMYCYSITHNHDSDVVASRKNGCTYQTRAHSIISLLRTNMSLRRMMYFYCKRQPLFKYYLQLTLLELQPTHVRRRSYFYARWNQFLGYCEYVLIVA